MKKIFTLFLALGMLAVAQAQPGSRDRRQDDQRNDQRNDQRDDQQNERQFDQRDFNDGFDMDGFDRRGRYMDKFSMEKRRKMEIARINRIYDFRIQRVQRNFYMSRWEKHRQIRFLEQQRQQEIRMIFVKYSDHKGRRHDRYDDNGRYDRQW